MLQRGTINWHFFYDAVEKVFNDIKENYNHEYWFINDGSSDNTLDKIKELKKSG